MIFECIFEDFGLIVGMYYDVQISYIDVDGKCWWFDVIVCMLQKKLLVIDSKVLLNVYEEVVNIEDFVLCDVVLCCYVVVVCIYVQ